MMMIIRGSTKNILDKIRNSLNWTFERYSCITLLIDNIEVYASLTLGVHNYLMLIERDGNTEQYISSKAALNHLPLSVMTMKMTSKAIYFNKFRRISELEKVARLSQWSDLIYVIKYLELTRGGELVELVYLLDQQAQDPLKYEF
jgi:hypothetical protein